MTRRLANCPECGGKLVSHFEGCRIAALRGVCATCDGAGRVTQRTVCPTCNGSGEAPRGKRDAAYRAAISIDAESHRQMDAKETP